MSEPIVFDDKDDNKSDFMKMGGNVLKAVNIKMTFFIFLLGILLFSDLFIDGVLSKINNAVDGECATTKGTLIQLLLLCVGYLILDLLVKAEWI